MRLKERIKRDASGLFIFKLLIHQVVFLDLFKRKVTVL